eukprot:4277263-Prymnesium_polylepis.3
MHLAQPDCPHAKYRAATPPQPPASVACATRPRLLRGTAGTAVKLPLTRPPNRQFRAPAA